VPPKKAGLFRYLKEAFSFRWNLLLFGGAAAAAAISGHADIALPLVAAAEITYLAGLTTLPRFQSAIDAKANAEERGQSGALAGARTGAHAAQQGSARDRILEVLKSLSEDRRARFLRLRARCVEMSRIANAVRGETRDASGASTELRQPALDRLLWVFLRLLLSEQAIARFLQAADEAGIDKTLGELKQRRKKRADSVGEANQADDRIIRSIDDSISTTELRKENVEKARHNAEFVAAELDRLENKIHAVTEMAVSHTDPDEMSSRIDAISEGISQTEQTIRELQSITGVADADTTPSILESDLSPQRMAMEGGAGRRPPGS
jgi:chemotaxis protein histidine kinase CheA